MDQKRSGKINPLRIAAASLLAAAFLLVRDTYAESWETPKPLVYRFQDNLDKAESWQIGLGGKKEFGDWEEDRFTFADQGPAAQIKLRFITVEGEESIPRIEFNPLKGESRLLRFERVPAAPQLVLSYAVESPSKGKGEPYYLKLRIWVGGKMLHEIRVPGETVEKTETIPLDLPYFLRRPLKFTFELYSENPEQVSFSFGAELRR